jgi:hypothetical protein
MKKAEKQAAGLQKQLTWKNDSKGIGKNYLNCFYAQVIIWISTEIRF